MPSDHTTTQLAVLDMAGTTITDDGVVQRSIDTTLRLCGLALVSPAPLPPARPRGRGSTRLAGVVPGRAPGGNIGHLPRQAARRRHGRDGDGNRGTASRHDAR
jgi:hypothetical protein